MMWDFVVMLFLGKGIPLAQGYYPFQSMTEAHLLVLPWIAEKNDVIGSSGLQMTFPSHFKIPV
jgi:hypothetical protein